jgi:hypothetical protein
VDLLLRVTSVPGATAATTTATPTSFVRLGVVVLADGAAAMLVGRMSVPSS